MTPSDFWLNAASNGVGSTIGAAAGILAGLYLDRRRQKRADAEAARLSAIELAATKARLAMDIAVKEERHRQEIRALVVALDTAVESNIAAIQNAENDISLQRYALDSAFDLFTWNALQIRVVDLIGDPAITGRLARFFANLKAFETLIDLHRRQDVSFSKQCGLQDRVVTLGPALRQEARLVRIDLHDKLQPPITGEPQGSP